MSVFYRTGRESLDFLVPTFPKRMPRLGLLPELAPEERDGDKPPPPRLARLRSALRAVLVRDEPTDVTKRPETRDTTAQLTVYAMTATVMVLAFPVGFALLLFNILGGENLRSTAHVLALTGTGVGLGIV